MNDEGNRLKQMQRERADELRREAGYLRQHADVLLNQAQTIERNWKIPPPCQLCGAREGCNH